MAASVRALVQAHTAGSHNSTIYDRPSVPPGRYTIFRAGGKRRPKTPVVVNYVYDPLGRKTAEVYPGIGTNSFAYSPASDLLSLTDGKSQVTAWNYDEYGRATNKLDANNRLTNRWTPAKGNAGYGLQPLVSRCWIRAMFIARP